MWTFFQFPRTARPDGSPEARPARLKPSTSSPHPLFACLRDAATPKPQRPLPSPSRFTLTTTAAAKASGSERPATHARTSKRAARRRWGPASGRRRHRATCASSSAASSPPPPVGPPASSRSPPPPPPASSSGPGKGIQTCAPFGLGGSLSSMGVLFWAVNFGNVGVFSLSRVAVAAAAAGAPLRRNGVAVRAFMASTAASEAMQEKRVAGEYTAANVQVIRSRALLLLDGGFCG